MFTVVAEDKALIAALPNPQEILDWVPDSFPLEFQGHSLVGMPHTLNNCMWLAARGLQPPSPIETEYAWPRDTVLIPVPFAHQIKTAGFLTINPRAYCLNDIGTGKTLTAAWAADYLMTQGYVQAVLIAAPLSTVERAWADTLFFHLRHRKVIVLHGSAEKRRKLLAQKADFYVINHDGVPVIERDLAQRPDINLYILDELAVYRNKHNKWKSLNALIHPAKRPAVPWVWGLTGKPTPNEPTDAFHQCKLVTPSTVPAYYSQFRTLTMDHQSQYVWTPRKEANKIVYDVLRPAIRYKRDQCLDLPGEIHSTLDVELSAEQKKHYKELMQELYTEIRGGKVSAMNEGIKLSKLLQIAIGVVYDSAGAPIEIDPGNRIETLLQTIECIDDKVICFLPFTEATNRVYREVSKHWSAALVYGDVPKKERDQIFADFQNKPDPSVLVAHPQCMAHGLTLTEASTIIWVAPVPSNDIYEQANGRITRPGQKYTANIIHLSGSAIERKMYKRLETRGKMQGVLLDMIEKNESLL